ncbi:unnamed protein product [Blepharisma stoltei]|uniref:Uncharacterized protein n=1 Tax=Blepharisma stoltei TaxID=1481888 RepID=A0AAU9IE95_9CILI|nr:unnamed protein product [Blepharisma stoltei]
MAQSLFWTIYPHEFAGQGFSLHCLDLSVILYDQYHQKLLFKTLKLKKKSKTQIKMIFRLTHLLKKRW